jgi:hypothetical protein
LVSLLVFASVPSAFAQDPIDPGTTGACAASASPCVPTYHNDADRDGNNPYEAVLSPSIFTGTPDFGLLKTDPSGATGAVDGLVYAQPLYLSSVSMTAPLAPGCSGSQNLVLVATENNSVYAFTYVLNPGNAYPIKLVQCWMLPLNYSNEFAIPFGALPKTGTAPCNNVVPQSGITGTPVVDTSVTPPVMYVVTADQTASVSYTYRIHAINVSNGKEVVSAYDLSAAFPSSISPQQQNQRPGLAMFKAAGATKANLYVAFGSFCDVKPYGGFVAALTFTYGKTPSFSPIAGNWVFQTEGTTTNQQGGIWMGGTAPAVDSAGNVYVAVANGTWDGLNYFGESAVKIATTSAGLTAVDYYTPNDHLQLDNDIVTVTLCSGYNLVSCMPSNKLTLTAPTGDFDLGSGGITIVSPVGISSPVCGTNGELIAGGKEGVTYGICYSTQTGPALETTMGGLDGCGYGCTTTTSDPTITACSSQTSPPGNGFIAECFQGVNAGENNSGTGKILGSPGTRGTEAFWAGPPSYPQNYLYVGGSGAALSAYQASPSSGLFNPQADIDQSPKFYPYPGTTPSISWNINATTHPELTGLLWAVDVGGYGLWNPKSGSQAASPAILYVYNPIPVPSGLPNQYVLNELWNSSTSGNDDGPGAVKYTVPTVANGLVFVAGGPPKYAPGPAGGTGVNCTSSYPSGTGTPTCGGMLSVYGKPN